jgi:hypothetical protein
MGRHLFIPSNVLPWCSMHTVIRSDAVPVHLSLRVLLA